MPNGARIQATHTAELDLPGVPGQARQCHIFQELQQALVAIGQFCDHGLEAHFCKTHVRILRGTTVVLEGTRNTDTGLWNMPLQQLPPTTSSSTSPAMEAPIQLANHVHEMRTKRDLVQYLHRSCGSPVTSTWLKAIEAGFFATWPGLTLDLVRKHLPKSIATAKGHMRQQMQGVRSTKPKMPPTQASTHNNVPIDEFQPTSNSPTRTNSYHMQAMEFTGQIFSDQTGRFPITSSRGNKYIMVVYSYDSNAILTEPMTSRTEAELLRAYTVLHTYLKDRGLKPTLQRLDNEAPKRLKQFMTEQGITWQLVPPGIHRTNLAEKAIGTWKDHFIAILASLDPNFPMHLWCRLIPQATTTLNLLRPSRINPRLSAEAQLNGAFDFNCTPFAPPGTRVLVHEKVGNRRTFASKGVDGWYIDRASDHYRNYRCYISKTASVRTADTVTFFPINVPCSAIHPPTTPYAQQLH